MKKLVYQMFVLGCGNIETALKNGAGGVILFTKDINSETELKTNINHYKKISLISPFIAIDQEGGRVERTESIKPKRLSPRFAYQKGLDFLKQQSDEISKELQAWGFNLNFAPCVDVNTNPINPIIGERAFADNPDDVIKGAEIFINSSRKNNIIPCIKHFPGHGDADKDSHLELPSINLSLSEMKNTHIKPFNHFIQKNIEMIMVAHLHCNCFDRNIIPTSLSPNTINYLRKDLQYNGVLISDDMIMKGVQSTNAIDNVIKGINAGLDMFIFRNSDAETLAMIEELVKIVEKDNSLKNKIISSNNRIINLKEKYGII